MYLCSLVCYITHFTRHITTPQSSTYNPSPTTSIYHHPSSPLHSSNDTLQYIFNNTHNPQPITLVHITSLASFPCLQPTNSSVSLFLSSTSSQCITPPAYMKDKSVLPQLRETYLPLNVCLSSPLCLPHPIYLFLMLLQCHYHPPPKVLQHFVDGCLRAVIGTLAELLSSPSRKQQSKEALRAPAKRIADASVVC